MLRRISVGTSDLARIRERDLFYVDKTDFIRQWWESGEDVTLVCRPRRFGKSLMMSTVECFFSPEYAKRGTELFGGTSVWKCERMRALHGQIPVVSITFGSTEGLTFEESRIYLAERIAELWRRHAHELDLARLGAYERDLATGRITRTDEANVNAIARLCELVEDACGRRPIILIDEYDAPLTHAWLSGFYEQMRTYVSSLMGATLKANSHYERALVTGVTRVSRESIFSQLNNLRVASPTTGLYADSFGFTEEEVFAGMDAYGRHDRTGVRTWYDGYTFGNRAHLYNPLSVSAYLESGEFDAYWARTSSNALVGSLVLDGGMELLGDLHELMCGHAIRCRIDEQVSFTELRGNPNAVWSLLLGAGYVRVERRHGPGDYELALTNHEVADTFDGLVRRWLNGTSAHADDFARAVVACYPEAMALHLAGELEAMASPFDVGTHVGDVTRPDRQPERFYHGIVLGLLASLRGRGYAVESNVHTGRGRCDIMLTPWHANDPGIVIELKVFDPKADATLDDTLTRAVGQAQGSAYVTSLVEHGVERERMHVFGIAFRGFDVVVGEGTTVAER